MKQSSPKIDKNGYSMWLGEEDHDIEDHAPFWRTIGCGIVLFLAAVFYGGIFYAIDWIVEFVKHLK